MQDSTEQSICLTAESSNSALLESDGLPLGPQLLVDSSLSRQTSKEHLLCADRTR